MSIWERAQASAAVFERAFKLRYMGIGFVWAWLYCSYETSALFAERVGISINADDSWLVSAVTVIVAFMVGGALLRHVRVRPFSLVTIAAPVALSLGTVLSIVGSNGGVALWAGGILTGVGYALISILWAMALSRLAVEELEVAIPLSALVTAVCSVLIPALQGALAAIATVLLPLVSGVLLVACFAQVQGDGTDTGEIPVSSSPAGAGRLIAEKGFSPWVRYFGCIMALLCVMYVAIGWEAACWPSDSEILIAGLDAMALASNVSTVVLAVALVAFSRTVNFSELFRWIMPLLIVSLALFSGSEVGLGFLSGVIADTSQTLMDVMLYLFVLTMAKQRFVSVPLGVGLANGSIQIGVLIGNIWGRACMAPEALVGPDEVKMALICLLAVSIIFVPRREPDTDANGIVVADSRELSLLEACRLLQERYGLSDRETEIAALVAQGRSRPYIREQLFISTNTVATHIKHIYGKLDIHSKEELIDMVNSEASAK